MRDHTIPLRDTSAPREPFDITGAVRRHKVRLPGTVQRPSAKAQRRARNKAAKVARRVNR